MFDFIDEIDAVRQRGAGIGGGSTENSSKSIATEMDGFEGNSGIIIIAATNRPDVLGLSSLRPGRFDRQVTVDAPDIKADYQYLRYMLGIRNFKRT